MHLSFKEIAAATVLSIVLTNGIMAQKPDNSSQTKDNSFPQNFLSAKDYTYGYWLNGRRKHNSDDSPDILCFESGHFGFHIDLNKIENIKFGKYTQAPGYFEALDQRKHQIDTLKDAKLVIEIDHEGQTYKATSSYAGAEKKLSSVRIWESGRYFQHFDVLGLNFKSDNGEKLPCYGELNIKMWPNQLELATSISPSYLFQDGPHHGVVGKGMCIESKKIESKKITFDPQYNSDTNQFSLESWIKIPSSIDARFQGQMVHWGGHESKIGYHGFKVNIDGRVGAVVNANGKVLTMYERNNAFKPDIWNHLVLSYDGSHYRYYVNGIMQGSEVHKQPWLKPKGPLMIGSQSKRLLVPGVYDQIRLYRKALSPDKIKKHFQQPSVQTSSADLVYSQDFEQLELAEIKGTPNWANTKIRMLVEGFGIQDGKERSVQRKWNETERQRIQLSIPFADSPQEKDFIHVDTTFNSKADLKTVFDTEWGCYKTTVTNVKRKWKTGYTDIRDYDEFIVTVENKSDLTTKIPFMLDLYNPANLTGVCPMICDEKGIPTGIPIQLSKNWHLGKSPNYLRSFSMLPCKPGKQSYMIRIAYGFYGNLPAASHAQLSLIGYGGNSRWDQLAIGCWGETICFDTDLSLVDNTITDVRALMSRRGKTGKKWSWTNAGWGGDWLEVNDASGNKLFFSEFKTAYTAHGPCMSEVYQDGYYGINREVKVRNKIRTSRTNDYARTFMKFHYTFNDQISTKDASLFRMGESPQTITDTLAFGHDNGLEKELKTKPNMSKGQFLVKQQSLSGNAPWWIGHPNNQVTHHTTMGTANRAFLIRSYKATMGGKTYEKPSFSAPYINRKNQKGALEVRLTPPEGISHFQKGDTIEFEIEWITIPQNADDYYGDNERFSKFITKYPNSWHSFYREAKLNDLEVTSQGGSVQSMYPIEIKAVNEVVNVTVKGGCGAVPIKFNNLKDVHDYKLFQVVNNEFKPLKQEIHGNDYWQSDYNPSTKLYSMTFNLPLDGTKESQWRLVKSK